MLAFMASISLSSPMRRATRDHCRSVIGHGPRPRSWSPSTAAIEVFRRVRCGRAVRARIVDRRNLCGRHSRAPRPCGSHGRSDAPADQRSSKAGTDEISARVRRHPGIDAARSQPLQQQVACFGMLALRRTRCRQIEPEDRPGGSGCRQSRGLAADATDKTSDLSLPSLPGLSRNFSAGWRRPAGHSRAAGRQKFAILLGTQGGRSHPANDCASRIHKFSGWRKCPLAELIRALPSSLNRDWLGEAIETKH